MTERQREKLHCECTMQCTVHCIIALFNVGNVLLCVIYQLNFTVFMYVTRISRYRVRSESRCALTLRYVDLAVSIEVAVAVCYCLTVFSC
jgi:hypothetical protein